MDDRDKKLIAERSSIPSRLRALDREGITYKLESGDQYIVAGRFMLHAIVGSWRSLDYDQVGYTVAGLISAVHDAELRDLIPNSARASAPEKPAAGRDSPVNPAIVHVQSGPDKSDDVTTAELTTDPDHKAESAAGDKLKLVWP